MKSRELLSQYVLLPVGKTISGRQYFKARRFQRFLEESERWSRERLDEFRLLHFKRLIAHCYEYVPYYQELFKRHNLTPASFTSLEDIRKIPVLEKETLSGRLNDLVAKNILPSRIRFLSTGGTTGEPRTFGRDLDNEYRVDGNNWRFWNYAGYRPGMSVALFWGNERELLRSETLWGRAKLLMDNTNILNCFDLTARRSRQYFKYMNERKPRIVRGFASGILHFVRFCRDQALSLDYSPDAVIVTTEKIYSSEKKELSAFFKAPVYEEYGAREVSIMAHECSTHTGLHLAEEMFIFEVVNSLGTAFDGRGEILVTPLFNFATPLLRYRLGDEVTIEPAECSCGRRLKRLKEVNGRIGDYIKARDGRLLHGEFFAHLFYDTEGIKQYQLIQNEKGLVVLNIVKSAKFREAELQRVLGDIQAAAGNLLTVTVNFVEHVNPSSSGKRRSVISYVE